MEREQRQPEEQEEGSVCESWCARLRTRSGKVREGFEFGRYSAFCCDRLTFRL
jgi:hypothetical protein